MRKSFTAGLLLLFMMSFLVACNQKEASHQQNPYQNLNLHISRLEGQSYTVYKKIVDNETVKTVMSVLLDVPWENAKVSMSRQPDYKIHTINTDPAISYEPVTYAVWLTPKKDRLEVIIEGKSKYGKMTKKDSEKLFSILETP
ncbi:hypothetical protein Back11_60780 [Paenibacillus baekrokdamisoli]|uniref:YhfM-like domain-containing protein n=1 Tax=Paenibacillus baekrokdamisoli TaxID=1712516 RepID=A0A3G9JID0_9BACL|nr:hypothetical protein [Paenibacillus baekrokdamisoli]BBH24733.1 hypothetical protein Back11_60780 [Paenibacillus baekrokdamisoli]